MQPLGHALLTRLAFELKLRLINGARPSPAGSVDAAVVAVSQPSRNEHRLAQAQRAVRALRARLVRQHAVIKRHEARVAVLEGGVGDPLVISKTGSQQLSWTSTIAMGVRRNLSNMAAADFGVTLLDVSRQTVCRSERLVGSCIVATSRQFFSEWRLALGTFLARSPAPPAQHSIINVYSWRSDATNSGVWQRQKVCALEAEAYVMLNPLPPDSTRTCQMCDVFSYIKRLSDVQTVTGGSGECTYRLIVKQLKGSDQVRARRIIAILTAPMPNVIFMGHNCWEHVVHLIIGQALKLADQFLKEWGRSWRYYSTVAICANVWREAARPIYLWWITACGPMDAKARASTLCPKACSARWGAVEAVEERLSAVAGALHTAFAAVLAGRAAAEAAPVEDAPGEAAAAAVAFEPVLAAGVDARRAVGDLSTDSAKAWSAMLGRWRRQAVTSTADPLFWGMVKCSLWSRSVTTHASCFLKATGRQHIAELACGKAGSLFSECDALLSAHPWEDLFRRMPQDDESTMLNSYAISNIMVHAGGFFRRLLEPAVTWPYRMFGLIYGGDRLADAPLRRQTADALLTTDPADLDIGTRKLCDVFARDLRSIRQRGVCPPRLWYALSAASRAWRSDTRENESINKTISLISERAPSVGLDLLSARCTTKHAIGGFAGTGDARGRRAGARQRWSPLPNTDSPLDPSINVATALRALCPDMRVSARRAWCVAHNSAFHSVWRTQPAGMSLCFCFGDSPQNGCPWWVSIERDRCRHVFAELRLDEPGMCARLVRPLTAVRSVRLFDTFFEPVRVSDGPVRMMCFRLTWDRKSMVTASLSALDDVHFRFVKFKQKPQTGTSPAAPLPLPMHPPPPAGGSADPSRDDDHDPLCDALATIMHADGVYEDELLASEAVSTEMAAQCAGIDIADAAPSAADLEFHESVDASTVPEDDRHQSITGRRCDAVAATAARKELQHRLDHAALGPAIHGAAAKGVDIVAAASDAAAGDIAATTDRLLEAAVYDGIASMAPPPAPPPPHAQPLTLCSARAALRAWAESFAVSIGALQSRRRACTADVGEAGQLSVMSISRADAARNDYIRRVCYAHWAQPRSCYGRPTGLMPDGTVAHPSNAHVRAVYLKTSSIVWPAIGVSLRACDKGAIVGAPVQRCHAMWTVALDRECVVAAQQVTHSPIVGDDESALEPCVACGGTTAPATLVQCALCLGLWHPACAASVVDLVREAVDGHRASLVYKDVPPAVHCWARAVCTAVVGAPPPPGAGSAASSAAAA
ncbi:unnamed protein product [Prorocentrum cordatum]|uniref:Uncharacterized protein n=1 Tax=Prorocentrum cordatum TaxID=2364126 RepID=A0ABN9SPZ3_9DINO|nr:unnamed protein product [Polarella glacialis]